jgi:hypothetical protein
MNLQGRILRMSKNWTVKPLLSHSPITQVLQYHPSLALFMVQLLLLQLLQNLPPLFQVQPQWERSGKPWMRLWLMSCWLTMRMHTKLWNFGQRQRQLVRCRRRKLNGGLLMSMNKLVLNIGIRKLKLNELMSFACCSSSLSSRDSVQVYNMLQQEWCPCRQQVHMITPLHPSNHLLPGLLILVSSNQLLWCYSFVCVTHSCVLLAPMCYLFFCVTHSYHYHSLPFTTLIAFVLHL